MSIYVRARRVLGAPSSHAFVAAFTITALALGSPSRADEVGQQSQPVPDPVPVAAGGDTDERLDRLEESVGILAEEQIRLRSIFAVPEDRDLTRVGGYGPWASKVYLRDRGLSIGGYGEWRGRFFVDDQGPDDKNELDALRMVLYTGYKFTDWLVFNAELEWEHAGTGGGGSVSVEFMSLDFLFDPKVNARAGLVLIPMGFINELHEPTFFFGASRPEVERRIIPTTWRENGAGIFGRLWGDRIEYRMYGVNGMDATGFASDGLRGGRQNGSEALAENWAFVGRTDVRVVDGLYVGGSVYTGKSGQNQVTELGKVPGTPTTIFELHGELKRWGLSSRVLWAMALLDDTTQLNAALGNPANDAVAKEMQGGYVEVAYDLMQWILPDSNMTLEPFYRFEWNDTQFKVADSFVKNEYYDRTLQVVGLQYKPHPQVVIKLDYRDIDSEAGDVADEVEIGFGFVF